MTTGIRTTFVTIGLAAMLAMPVFAAVEDGERYTLREGETLNENLYAAGGEVTIAGTVEGDVTAAGGNVLVTGTVTQDLLVAGGDVDLRGAVGGDIRAAGGTVTISGTIVGDVLVGGGNVRLLSGASVGGDVIAGAGSLILDGAVGGDVRAGAGSVSLSGTVGGSVFARVDELILGEMAAIAGDLRYTATREADIREGAVVAGAVDFTERMRPDRREARYAAKGVLAALGVVKTLLVLVLALVLFWLMRRPVQTVVHEGVTRPGRAALTGFVVLIAAPVAIIVSWLTIAGALIGFFMIPLLIASGILGMTLGGVVFGAWAWQRYKKLETPILNWKIVAGGIVLAAVLRAIPWIGWIFGFALFLIAFGAIWQTVYRWARPHHSEE